MYLLHVRKGINDTMVQLKRVISKEDENIMARLKTPIKTNVEAATEVTPTPQAQANEVHTTTLEDGTVAVKTPKVTKPIEPKAWQKIVEENGKQKLVNQIVFLGETTDYNGDFKVEYKWGNLKLKDGLTRIVTARFPKTENPDATEDIKYKGYNLKIEKYGNSAVCELANNDGVILRYVSLATVIDVLQDLLNPGETCDIPWGTIDQSIKLKRGLKSRIKSLNENDLPAGRRKATVEATAESTTEEGAPSEQTN